MNYKGIIIEESLENLTVLKKLTIVSQKIEPITKNHQTPWLNQWTLDTVTVPKEKIVDVVEEISNALDSLHEGSWYVDFKNDKFHYIIFLHKSFKIDLSNPILYKNAREYGISLGIPAHQVNFAPDDMIGKDN